MENSLEFVRALVSATGAATPMCVRVYIVVGTPSCGQKAAVCHVVMAWFACLCVSVVVVGGKWCASVYTNVYVERAHSCLPNDNA